MNCHEGIFEGIEPIISVTIQVLQRTRCQLFHLAIELSMIVSDIRGTKIGAHQNCRLKLPGFLKVS